MPLTSSSKGEARTSSVSAMRLRYPDSSRLSTRSCKHLPREWDRGDRRHRILPRWCRTEMTQVRWRHGSMFASRESPRFSCRPRSCRFKGVGLEENACGVDLRDKNSALALPACCLTRSWTKKCEFGWTELDDITLRVRSICFDYLIDWKISACPHNLHPAPKPLREKNALMERSRLRGGKSSRSTGRSRSANMNVARLRIPYPKRTGGLRARCGWSDRGHRRSEETGGWGTECSRAGRAVFQRAASGAAAVGKIRSTIPVFDEWRIDLLP